MQTQNILHCINHSVTVSGSMVHLSSLEDVVGVCKLSWPSPCKLLITALRGFSGILCTRKMVRNLYTTNQTTVMMHTNTSWAVKRFKKYQNFKIDSLITSTNEEIMQLHDQIQSITSRKPIHRWFGNTVIIQLIFLQQYFPIPVLSNIHGHYCMGWGYTVS